jgi:hypothetical protein
MSPIIRAISWGTFPGEGDMACRVAIVTWTPGEEVGLAIRDGLCDLGFQTGFFEAGGAVAKGVDVVFSFGPSGRLLPVLRQLRDVPLGERPLFVHWNTEQIPDLRIPWEVVTRLGALRSWAERLYDRFPFLWQMPVLARAPDKMTRFRYVGDYHYAYRQGWLDLLVESSEIYASLYRRHGLDVLFVPWGTAAAWYDDVDIERDIDVLWMGKRRTKRRSRWIDRIRSQLAARGLTMCVVDNVERPFVYGAERTELLNRSKITLNLLPRWHDDAFSYRFHVAAGNRSLIVSEPIVPHCSVYRAGVHYVSAPAESMVDTLVYYLEHDPERQAITDAAYRLVTERMTFSSSVRAIMEAVDELYRGGSGSRLALPVSSGAVGPRQMRSHHL